MDTLTEPAASGSRSGSTRWRSAGYWLATVLVAAELAVGGAWDIARIPSVHSVVVQLGYPSYFLVLLGTWKVLGAAALLVPRRALLKEWAYAGAFFTYTGAIASHLTTGYALGEVPVLALLTALIALSWALRPPSRRTSTAPLAAAVRDTPGVAQALSVTGHGAASAGPAIADADARWKER
jgi:hypothetical protein